MEEIPVSALSIALFLLLIISGFFSLAETSMMAVNRYRLRHRAAQGHRGARLALDLLARTDKMLGVVLLGNNLINAASATLVSVIAIELFGEEKWALGAGTLFVTFAILVVSEITPKIIGAAHADRLAGVIAFLLWPLLRMAYPVVWFVNLFAQGLLWLLRLKPGAEDGSPRLTQEELRAVVLESSHLIPSQHRAILSNLFDLEHVTVEDIMTPRSEIEAIDLASPPDQLRTQLATSYHTRLPVYENDPGNVIGILHQRRLLGGVLEREFDIDTIREQLVEPYFIPAATQVYAQIQFFRENRQRLGLVVDEYGEIKGLVTIEDIIEEIVGKFTTGMPGSEAGFAWNDEGIALVDGAHSLRELNRVLDLQLPLDGPKTLNGLIIEHLQDIPEVGVSIKIAGVPMEIVQTQNRRIRMVKLFRPPISFA
ncbi:MAG: HlyC/CorC family transporter [Candidatus Nitricoxidivorans perseverans]|uniref:HlyC/CorC family transporter n=1 Tax=Candidatus Nitricoxidivorans perseverans TaxID=2975601 RepID=A0AA49FJE4_9PROT|nr:MAG: HlyC/CorC family transporter [Candidatus Nitricoxidivorans perseverans]